MAKVEYAKGLEGVIAAESKICKIDGEKGLLYYMGYSIEDLVKNTTYEEVTYLLLYGELPTKEQLDDFSGKMRNSRALKPPIIRMIKDFPRDSHPMELLQSAISFLSGYVDHKIQHSPTCNCRMTLHQIAQMPTVIAAFHRFKNGHDYVPPKMDLSHGANFLYMLHGQEPDPLEGEIMDKCLILHSGICHSAVLPFQQGVSTAWPARGSANDDEVLGDRLAAAREACQVDARRHRGAVEVAPVPRPVSAVIASVAKRSITAQMLARKCKKLIAASLKSLITMTQ